MKKVNKSVVFSIFFILVFAAAVFLIASMLYLSNQLRKFKVDTFVLCNEADICVAESSEGRYRVASDNLMAINALLSSTTGSFTVKDPKEEDRIELSFTHDKEEWHMTIIKAEGNKLGIQLDGARNYKFYLKENKKFAELKKAVSKDGYNTSNKPF